MINTLDELKIRLRNIFPNIQESCEKCRYPDCRGYIHLLEEKVDSLLNDDISVVCLNESVYLIDSFRRREDGNLDLTEFSPKCRLRCQNGDCSIHEKKPLICLSYPIIIDRYQDGKDYWVFHKQCQYYDDVSNTGQKEEIINSYMKLIDEVSPELKANIKEAYYAYSSVVSSNYTDWDLELIKEVK